jgi:hypothetical protein
LGGLVWSPDSRFIALTYARGSCLGDGETSIIVIDTQTQRQTLFRQTMEQPWATTEWGTNRGLVLIHLDLDENSGELRPRFATLDPATGQVTEIWQ